LIIFDSNKRALFNPHNLDLAGHPKKALLIFDDEVWDEYVTKSPDIEKIPVKNNQGKVFNTLLLYKYGPENIVLMYPSTGGSAAAIDLELLIASGIEKFVAFGTGGAMANNIAKNTVIVPTSAVREEGVSYHYLPLSDEIAQKKHSISLMKQVFAQHKVSFLMGKVWTTDAVYRETAKKLKLMTDKGCLVVDMEMASLLAVAEFRGVDFAGFLITDDNIAGKSPKENERNLAKLVKLALEVLVRI